MIGLQIIRSCFTPQFQRDFGDAWESASEDMLLDARRKGDLALIVTWLGIILDTAWRAPLMHLQDFRSALIGQPLVLAGLSPVQGTIAVANHWVWRPASSLWMWTASYAAVALVGIMMAFATNAYLSYRSASEVSYQLERTLDDNHALVFNNSILWLVVFLALGATSLGARQMWSRWRSRGCPVLAPAFVLACCWMITMFSFFINELPSVSTQAISPFLTYPHYKNTPVSNPNGLDEDMITDAHKVWYRPVLNASGTAQSWELIPEKKDAWCATRIAVLGIWEAEINSRPYQVGHEITALLWRAHLLQAGADGCLNASEILRRDTAMALWTNANVSSLERKWRPMISFVPLVDAMLSGKYIVGLQVLPQAINYCLLASTEKARAQNQELNPSQSFCIKLSEEWTARHTVHSPRLSAPALNPVFSPFSTNTAFFEEELHRIPVFDQDDLTWVRQRIDDNWSTLVLSSDPKSPNAP